MASCWVLSTPLLLLELGERTGERGGSGFGSSCFFGGRARVTTSSSSTSTGYGGVGKKKDESSNKAELEKTILGKQRTISHSFLSLSLSLSLWASASGSV